DGVGVQLGDLAHQLRAVGELLLGVLLLGVLLLLVAFLLHFGLFLVAFLLGGVAHKGGGQEGQQQQQQTATSQQSFHGGYSLEESPACTWAGRKPDYSTVLYRTRPSGTSKKTNVRAV